MATHDKTISLAITGASGMQYSMRLLECLVRAEVRVYLMFSRAAQVVAGLETDWNLPSRPTDIADFLTAKHAAASGQLQVFGESQWTAPVASGSGAPDAMVVCPCTTGTLSAIACGSCNTLIERAADVVIKERRQLVIMPREMPFSAIHLENMRQLALLGVVVMPPNPGFYHRPARIADLVDFVVARVLDQLQIAQDLVPRWGT